jgi:hypothetical protein
MLGLKAVQGCLWLQAGVCTPFSRSTPGQSSRLSWIPPLYPGSAAHTQAQAQLHTTWGICHAVRGRVCRSDRSRLARCMTGQVLFAGSTPGIRQDALWAPKQHTRAQLPFSEQSSSPSAHHWHGQQWLQGAVQHAWCLCTALSSQPHQHQHRRDHVCAACSAHCRACHALLLAATHAPVPVPPRPHPQLAHQHEQVALYMLQPAYSAARTHTGTRRQPPTVPAACLWRRADYRSSLW